MDEARDKISILVAAIEIERFGYEYYMQLSKCVKDERGSALFRGLARDEEMHRSMIESEIHRIQPDAKLSELKPLKRYAGLIPQKIFSENLQENCRSVEGEIKIIEVGISVEDNSIRLYTDAASITSDSNVKALLERLAKWEEGHKKLLEENIHMLKLEGTWYGYVPILEG
ncbi:MAG: ferritin family protein [Methanomassiliicoccales archaeon]|nr:ferritin family protein [Methanomassiliicoccales archaeon]